MDLIEQLRFVHCRVDTSGRWLDADVVQPIMIKAAAEIERLEQFVAFGVDMRPALDAKTGLRKMLSEWRGCACRHEAKGKEDMTNTIQHWKFIEEQKVVIAELRAEIERLRNDIAERINVNRERWQEIERLQAVNKILSQRICDLTKKP